MHVIHLQHGLAVVEGTRESAGERFLIVRVAGLEPIWIRAVNESEQVRALPSREEAEAWRSRALAAPRPGLRADKVGTARRVRTLRGRDFDRKAAALCDAYACGDPIAELEEHVLPVYAHVLGVTVDALRDQLRSAPRAPLSSPAPPRLATPSPELEPLGWARFSASVCAGDPPGAEIEVLPGAWAVFDWTFDPDEEFPALLAIHGDYVAHWPRLRDELADVDENAGTDGGNVALYDRSMLEDELELEELWDPVDPPHMGERGFARGRGGDGGYSVAVASRDGKVVCIALDLPDEDDDDEDDDEAEIAPSPPPPPRSLAEEIDAWRGGTAEKLQREIEMVKQGHAPLTPELAAALERLLARMPPDGAAMPSLAATALACRGVYGGVDWLMDAIERGVPVHDKLIAMLLQRGSDPDVSSRVLERLRARPAAWEHAAASVLSVLVGELGCDAALPMLNEIRMDDTRSPSVRFDAACALLRATGNCELALELCAQSETGGNNLDRFVDAVERHAGDCAACRLELVQVLFRLLRAGLAPRTMFGRLTRLTGASTEDELWAWIAAERQDP